MNAVNIRIESYKAGTFEEMENHHSGYPEDFPDVKNLLPADFDTGDLIVVLLLLLMSGDCQEDQNWALLTLVLYLFL